MAAIQFDQGICGNPAESLKREWLETSGLGGFASSTIAGANTRRYHGLLVAALQPPGGRCLLLSKLEETLVVNNRHFELSTNLYPGVTHPEGYRYLIEFRLDPFPVFTFQAGGVKVEKRIFMVHGENTVVVEYAVDFAVCRLELRPLVAFRGYHDLTHANPALDGSLGQSTELFSIRPYPDLPRLYVAHNARKVRPEANWYFNFEYPVERERGLEFREDLFCPCVLDFDLAPGKPAVAIASTAMHRPGEAMSLRKAEIKRRGFIDDSLDATLTAAAGQFIVKRERRHTIIAGYPWFSDWGRDAMIALPGLTLVTGRFDLARDILLAFAEPRGSGYAAELLSGSGRSSGIQHGRRHFLVLRSCPPISGIFE